MPIEFSEHSFRVFFRVERRFGYPGTVYEPETQVLGTQAGYLCIAQLSPTPSKTMLPLDNLNTSPTKTWESRQS